MLILSGLDLYKLKQEDKPMWLNSIIFQLTDTDLADVIAELINPLDVDVLLGDQNSPDLIAIPFFCGCC